MTRDDFVTLWNMLTGVWPRLDTPETAAAWWGLLGNYPIHHATSAMRHWASERRTAPTPADIIEGIKAIVQETSRTRRLPSASPSCDECEGTGFVWTSFAGQGTVRRCGRGCMPADRSYLDEDLSATDPTAWIARFDQLRREQARKRAELGEAEYLRINGYDPARYRIRDGMIVTRPRGATR